MINGRVECVRAQSRGRSSRSRGLKRVIGSALRVDVSKMPNRDDEQERRQKTEPQGGSIDWMRFGENHH